MKKNLITEIKALIEEEKKKKPSQELKFHIISDGDKSVGIQGFYEEVTIQFRHGGWDLKGIQDSLEESLSDLTDGKVIFHPNEKDCTFCKNERLDEENEARIDALGDKQIMDEEGLNKKERRAVSKLMVKGKLQVYEAIKLLRSLK